MSDKIIQKDLFGNEIKDVLSKNKTKGKKNPDGAPTEDCHGNVNPNP